MVQLEDGSNAGFYTCRNSELEYTHTPTPSGVKNSLIEEAFNCSPVS